LLSNNFAYYLHRYDSKPPFLKPGQLELHRKTIDLRCKLGTVENAIADDHFLDLLYNTLIKWGLGVRGSHLVPPNQFREALRTHLSSISRLQTIQISEVGSDKGKVITDVWQLVKTLPLSLDKTPIVVGTKTLHHLLPSLVPPMDRKYTQRFFQWHNPQIQKQPDVVFRDMFGHYIFIAHHVHPASYVGSGWRSSPSKVIDNAIVAFCEETKFEGMPK
jgi:hypothetical protein